MVDHSRGTVREFFAHFFAKWNISDFFIEKNKQEMFNKLEKRLK